MEVVVLDNTFCGFVDEVDALAVFAAKDKKKPSKTLIINIFGIFVIEIIVFVRYFYDACDNKEEDVKQTFVAKK